MAKKISAIVIPAVIDTTGIDKGINSIKTKLSGVRGSIGTRNSGTGGVGGGGNFGSGLQHHGGSAVTVGAAAAVGAGFGGARRRFGDAGMNMKTKGEEMIESKVRTAEWRKRQTPISRGLQNLADRQSAMGRALGRANDEFGEPSSAAYETRRKYANAARKAGEERRVFARKFAEKPYKGTGSEIYGASKNGANEQSMFSGKRLATGVITAGIAGAAYLRNNFTQGGIKSSFSDLSNLEGNRGLYNRAIAIKRRTYGPTGMPTFAQSMIIGSDLQSEKTNGTRNAEGVASETDKIIAGAGVVLGKRVEFISSILTGDAFKGSNFWKGLKSVFS